MEMQLAFIKSKLNGERYIRTQKKNPKLKSWITKNMFLITLFWQLIFLCLVGVFELIFSEHENSEAIINWAAVGLGVIFQVSLFFFYTSSFTFFKNTQKKNSISK